VEHNEAFRQKLTCKEVTERSNKLCHFLDGTWNVEHNEAFRQKLTCKEVTERSNKLCHFLDGTSGVHEQVWTTFWT